MATTTNYSWTTPDNTAYVKDGASAIRTLGSSVDTTLFTALGGAYPGLRLVKKQTIGSAVASVAVTGAFSATYENYLVIVSGGTMSATNSINVILGATTSNYSNVLVYGSYTSTTVTAANNNAGSSWTFMGYGNTNTAFCQFELYQPFLSKNTLMASNHMQFAGLVAGRNGGVLNDSSSYTGFTITPASGTLTGGTIYVYGYGAS